VAKTTHKQAVHYAALVDAANTLSSRLIFKSELLRLIGVSYGSIFSWMRAGKFPLAIEIGPGGRSCKIAWIRTEVEEWLATRPRRRMKVLKS
jgi:predicted DNA-binding transcriptional regulator AlpA